MALFSKIALLVSSLPCSLYAIDDAAALVQVSTEAGLTATRTQALAHSVAGRAMAAVAASQAPPGSSGFNFNCTKNPLLCEAPFNCGNFNEAEYMTMQMRGFAPEGHSNLRTWCFSADYEKYMHACIVEKDLVKAAHIQYQWSVDKHNTTGVDELDGSYCFIEGHCTNAAVTTKTTQEEADRMCDERYGREEWSQMGKLTKLLEFPKMDEKSGSKTTGFHDPKVTEVFLKLACAMGNYHCDVMYCKETYCKNPYYVRKYGHQLPRTPGHLLQRKLTV